MARIIFEDLPKDDQLSTAEMRMFFGGFASRSAYTFSTLANRDQQVNLQKQQQTLQMLSNVSKLLHDTAQAVVRKIG
jgi:hypothetical protein